MNNIPISSLRPLLCPTFRPHPLSYNKLWKLLIDKKMSVADMRKAADIAPNTVTRMKKDQEVTLSVLEKICDVLDVDFGDIIEFKK